MAWKTLDDMDLNGKRVLIRVDINVPMEDGRVTDTTRIDRIVPTVRDVLAAGGTPILMAHYGRPKGKVVPEMSLSHVVPALSDILGQPVTFIDGNYGERVAALETGEIAMLENLRFNPGEEANDDAFAGRLASLGDVYVNDAFSAAHRAHASTEALAKLLPACAGRLMQAELSALEGALATPKRPVVAVVGGAKVSTKLDLLGNLVSKVNHLVIGGGMANTFLAAKGIDVGKSLCEHDLADTARDILQKADAAGCKIHLPTDIVVAREFKAGAEHEILPVDQCPADAMILDAGPDTVKALEKVFTDCNTLIWNGPLGAFEIPPFDFATNAAARKAADLTRAGKLVSVAGGGDTVAALNGADAADDFTYISTAGGAFLEWMEGKTLPGVAALEG
ncbi:phosphoglycerate kinase [Litoreibacter arenae]|uniref:Phosphoglycerate kinase n=1 Tax=Litoreibacter arenae DSM 19593 TaxID=1123360 RepID=S9QKT3_9RHOB|nr:phosphoglycerate kinase [Litoreibacter arenae]EPX80198.1 Phosphoglycerate kinase [Litoreibacter arenae DSM 19593]